MKKQILIIYAVILGVGLTYFIWGKITGMYIPCMYYETTGFLCPGCGLSRMFLSMARLDFVSAFFYNPLMFVLFFYWNTVAVLCFIGKPRAVTGPRFLYSSLWLSIASFVIFAILRNIL